MRWYPICIPLFLVGGLAFADGAEKKTEGYSVFFNHGDLVLEKDGKVQRFYTPKALAEHGRFQVKIPKPQEEQVPEEIAPKQPTLAERIEARRVMHEANQAFFKGEVARTWELVAQAEALDPSFYRIKTMKGSLLYKIGSKDLAVEVWQESLAQNPDQPEIVQVLKQIEGGALRPEVAKGSITKEQKASF